MYAHTNYHAWCVHSPGLLIHRRHGTGGSHLLQAFGKHDFAETTTPVPNRDGVATLQTVVCITTFGHHVHPWQQVVLPSPCPWGGHGHHSCYIRGAGAHLNSLLILHRCFFYIIIFLSFIHSITMLAAYVCPRGAPYNKL